MGQAGESEPGRDVMDYLVELTIVVLDDTRCVGTAGFEPATP